MNLKTLVTGAAAAAAVGAAAAGVNFLASSGPAAAQVQPVVFSTPLPLDQTANQPTADQLTTVLNNLADPNVPFANKSGLVEGGIPSGQAHLADHEIKKAAKNGELPLTFNVSNILSTPNGASAAVAISGPKLQPPVTENLTFVNQGSWMLSHDSAMMLVQAVSGD